mmetsp:Transcript_54989/g.154270  ORF Transcript_54989/g.154270 Transcript_54989/m.154270 type:complete len:243 (+) Transcript_54989:320-1048(+)
MGRCTLGLFPLRRRFRRRHTITVIPSSAADTETASTLSTCGPSSATTLGLFGDGATMMPNASGPGYASPLLSVFSSASSSPPDDEWSTSFPGDGAAVDGDAEGDNDSSPMRAPSSWCSPAVATPSPATASLLAPSASMSGTSNSLLRLRPSLVRCRLLQIGHRRTLRGLCNHHCWRQSAWKVWPHCVTRMSSPASMLHKQTTHVSSVSPPSYFVTGNLDSMSANVIFFLRSCRCGLLRMQCK